MLTIPNKLAKYFRAAQSKLAAIVSFVTDTLGDEQSTLADWQNGGLGGVAGVDYPATALTAGVATGDTTITVASTVEFTVGDLGNHVGFLALWDGTNREIVSYTGSSATTFTGLTRGLYGTSPRVYNIADFVLQVKPGLGESPEYNLTVAQKNYIQPNVGGAGPPVARTGARMIYSPTTKLYYLFGGYDNVGAVYQNDLWTFDPATNNWALLVPIGGPPAIRGFHVMVLTTPGGIEVIQIFGGKNAGGLLVDTWAYTIGTNTWSTNVAWNHPLFVAGYAGASGAYVHNDGGTYIFGGYAGPVPPRRPECYFFSGIAWTQCTSMPIGIAYGQATYLEFTNQILYVGVQADINSQITYLWTPSHTATSYWDNTTVAPMPALRRHAVMVYDSVNRHALVFGGESTLAIGTKTLYEYDAIDNTWTQLSTYQRNGRTQGAGAYDPDNRESLFWGGALDWSVPVMPVFPNPIRFRYYWESAKYYTDPMDVGEVPLDSGEWILEDITDTTYGNTSIEYQGEWSATGIAPWTNIGIIKDGDEITVLSRYWRVYVDMKNEGVDVAARVTKIDSSYNKYNHYSMASEPIGEYPPLVKSIGTLSSKVDVQTCKGSIGTMRIELIRSGQIADQTLMNAFPKRKAVRVKLGVLEDDIAISDFHTVLRARADDWQASRTQLVFGLADYIDELKQDIPQEDMAGIVVPLDYSVGGIAHHPVDIILDILQNQINIPDRDLDLNSFLVVSDHPSIAGWQFRREFCCPEDASKILEDLCKHIGAALVPREDGKIALILFNSDDDVVMLWNELDQAFGNEQFMGKASSVRNYISTWWNWDGDGDEVTDWAGIEVATDATSITRHGNKLLRIKSKWLGKALPPPNPPYAGDVIALAISDRILDMSKVGLQEISLDTNMSAFEAQVGDLISVQSSTIRDNHEYKEWQRANEGERDKRVMDVLSGCEDIAEFVNLWQAGADTLDTGVFMYGDGCLNLGKTGAAAQQCGYTRTVAVDLTNYDYLTMGFFITDPAILRAAIAVHVEFRTVPGAWYQMEYDVADLKIGWNTLGGLKSDYTLVGAGDWADIRRYRIYFWTPLIGDLIAVGDIKMDHWLGHRWQTPAASTGRYSMPYIVYGSNECVDRKFWIKSKNVDFAKGSIKWGLTRARQVPLDADYTDQADWYTGQGDHIDFETTPGSVLLAIEAAPNYYQAGYGEINIDLEQQPEQDGAFTIEDTIPAGTGITYQVWSSETGKWTGEENYLGFVVDGDDVAIRARYYKIRADLFSDTAKLLTPQVDRFLIRFDLG